MVEFNRGSWMAVKQKQLVKKRVSLVCNGEIQNDFKMTNETDYIYIYIYTQELVFTLSL